MQFYVKNSSSCTLSSQMHVCYKCLYIYSMQKKQKNQSIQINKSVPFFFSTYTQGKQNQAGVQTSELLNTELNAYCQPSREVLSTKIVAYKVHSLLIYKWQTFPNAS